MGLNIGYIPVRRLVEGLHSLPVTVDGQLQQDRRAAVTPDW